MNKHFEKWNQLSPLGLLIIGFGISLIGESVIMKSRKQPFWKWFFIGTLALITFNAGIAIFGDAIKERALYEMSLREPQ